MTPVPPEEDVADNWPVSVPPVRLPKVVGAMVIVALATVTLAEEPDMEKEAFEMVKLSVLPKFVIVPVLLRLPAPLRRAVEAVLWIVPAFVEAAPIVSVLARSTVPPALTVSVP